MSKVKLSLHLVRSGELLSRSRLRPWPLSTQIDGKTVPVAVALYAGLNFSMAALYIFHRISSLPFGDQWEVLHFLTQTPSTNDLAHFLYRAHNEHVILTSKVVYYIDFFFLNGKNLFSIATIYLTAIATAVLYAWITAYRILNERIERLALAGAAAACLTALRQWENLTWGFQPQFYLVLLGALVATVLTYNYLTSGRAMILAGLAIVIPFTVFSMGNGVLIFVPMIAMMLALRSTRRTIAPLIIVAISIAIFTWLVSRGQPAESNLPQSPANLLMFFLAMIGGPIASKASIAIGIGALAVTIFCAWATAFLLLPWLKRAKLDGPSLVLAAFALFLFATAAAASYARAKLGIDTALSSRYATPMIMLLLTLGSLIFRALVLCRTWPGMPISSLAISTALLATILNVDADARINIESRYNKLQNAAFRIASGIESDAALMEIYPFPDKIRPTIAVLRNKRLSLFADPDMTVPADTVISDPHAARATCALGHIDLQTRLSATAVSLEGWVAQLRGRRPPEIVLALEEGGRLLGFTRPMTHAPDRHSLTGSRRPSARFVLPVNLAHATGPRDSVIILAVFGGPSGMTCQLPDPID